jgi:hypothetical protein
MLTFLLFKKVGLKYGRVGAGAGAGALEQHQTFYPEPHKKTVIL